METIIATATHGRQSTWPDTSTEDRRATIAIVPPRGCSDVTLGSLAWPPASTA